MAEGWRNWVSGRNRGCWVAWEGIWVEGKREWLGDKVEDIWVSSL